VYECNQINVIKTNARAFDLVYLNAPSKQENKLRGFFEATLRRIKRHVLRINQDDYNWNTYSDNYYGPEQHREQLCYTTSLGELEFIFQNHKLYTISDGKPIHYVHRSVYESVCNLPSISSVAEIGFGNGKHLVNMGYLLGPDIKFYGFDISQKQINLFHETFSKEGKGIQTGIRDNKKLYFEKNVTGCRACLYGVDAYQKTGCLLRWSVQLSFECIQIRSDCGLYGKSRLFQ